MPSGEPDKVYYCTACRLEIRGARVCPKCHRKGTLVPVGESTPGLRPRETAARGVARAARARRRWLILAGALLAALTVVLLLVFAGRKTPPGRAPQRQATPPEMKRVFGATPRGARPRVPPAPKLCGTHHRLVVTVEFTSPPKKPGQAKPKAAKKAKEAKKAKKAKKPMPAVERRETVHEFLLATQRKRRLLVPLRLDRSITARGRRLVVFSLSRRGAILPDPRRRRLARHGFHDHLPDGYRPSDIIGRAQAELVPDPGAGLRVRRILRRDRLVQGFVRATLGLSSFLRPRPPKPDTKRFVDTRPPPLVVAPKDTRLVRRFQLRKTAAASTTRSFQVDAPATLMKKHRSTIAVQGEVDEAPGQPLPIKARLVLTGVPTRRGRPATVEIRLQSLGRACNRR